MARTGYVKMNFLIKGGNFKGQRIHAFPKALIPRLHRKSEGRIKLLSNADQFYFVLVGGLLAELVFGGFARDQHLQKSQIKRSKNIGFFNDAVPPYQKNQKDNGKKAQNQIRQKCG